MEWVLLKDSTTSRRYAQALVALLIVGLLASSTASAITITQPDFRSGDWFEYDGWTAAVFAEYEAKMAEESPDYERLNLTEEVPMRLTFQDEESINLGGEDTNCRVSMIEHSVNMTVHFTPGSTDYTNDTMTLNVTTNIKVWMPTEECFRESVETIMLETWFSGGGEDNYIESRLTTEEIIERDGLWPSGIEVGHEWDFAETISRTTVTEERINRALWNEPVARRITSPDK